MEEDIETFARAKDFPILPCNLCGTQPDAQRAKVKMLVDSTFTMLNPNAKRNMVNAMGDIRLSHFIGRWSQRSLWLRWSYRGDNRSEKSWLNKRIRG
jgi:hypothetical protein